MYRKIAVLGALCLSVLAHAQDNKTGIFRIVQFPQLVEPANPRLKDSLNRSLSKVTNQRQVFDLLNRRLKAYQNQPVRIRETLKDGSHQYYIYEIGAPRAKEMSMMAVLAAKEIVDETIYNLYQFRTFFADTLAIIDTLNVPVYPADFNFSIRDYYLETDGGMVAIPGDGANKLFLYVALLGRSGDGYPRCSLYHRSQPEKPLSACTLHFLLPEEKEELKDVVLLLKEDHSDDPAFGIMEAAAYLSQYAKARWGNFARKNLLVWLNKNYQ